MKILLAQPATLRFQWELEVLLTNLRQFGTFEIVLLFSEHDFTVPSYFQAKYPECSVFTYMDRRSDTGYIPSIRPYLWWQHLAAHPEAEDETYLYIDSDIIFREMIDCATLGVEDKVWVSSDCSGYIGYDYVSSRIKGDEIAARMAEITGITIDQLKATPGAGAQWVIKHPTAAFWERAYNDSNAIYDYFQTVDSDIQKWTAEMWAQLFGMTREGITVKIDKELDFCRPTDDIAQWDKVKIMHNAGVLGPEEMFFKGAYVAHTPFGEDFSYVREDKVSHKYVEAIKKVVN